MIKYWNEEYYLSYLPWNEGKKHMDESVPVSKTVGEKGAVLTQTSNPRLGACCAGGACVRRGERWALRCKDGPSVGASRRGRAFGGCIMAIIGAGPPAWGGAVLNRAVPLVREMLISLKTPFPTTELHVKAPCEAEACSKPAGGWINAERCGCCGSLWRSKRGYLKPAGQDCAAPSCPRAASPWSAKRRWLAKRARKNINPVLWAAVLQVLCLWLAVL